MDRRKTGDVLYMAIQWALQDRRTLLDCYSGDHPDTEKDIKALINLSEKIFGESRSPIIIKMQEDLKSGRSKSVSIQELKKLIKNDTNTSP